MKKLPVAALCLFLTLSCQKSLEQRAADEAEEYTRRECPREIAEDIIQDSMSYDNAGRTLEYHFTLNGRLDNISVLQSHASEYEQQFRHGILSMPALKVYADNGFAFRYVYRSGSTGKVLLDLNVRPSQQKHK